MMLSPQAARMGTVYTTLRNIGCSGRVVLNGIGRNRYAMLEKFLPFGSQLDGTFPNITKCNRFKSTLAADESDDETNLPYESITLETKSKLLNAMKKAKTVDTNHSVDGESPQNDFTSNINAARTANLGRDKRIELIKNEWFTGVSPGNASCPGVDEFGAIRSLPLPNLSKLTRKSIKDYFDNSWTLYETMFAGLKGEEPFYRPPVHGLRHPQIFYYGHTACLYVNKLRVAGVLQNPVNAYFESIFEIGVDEMLWDDMHKNDMIWPTVSEVHEYRKQVYAAVSDVIDSHPLLDDSIGPIKVDQSHPMWALFMGFEHDRIHLETSSVLFRETPLHLVQTPINWPPLHPSAYRKTSSVRTGNPIEGQDFPINRMILVDNQHSVDLGKPANFPSYGWDNEYGERTVDVPPFYASEFMVTNGEFWRFVADGGYRSREYWCDEGWAWRSFRNIKWPFFWECAGPSGSHEFGLRTIFEEIPMAWDWPVDVNYYEAKAFCSWKTRTHGSPTSNPYRLLTEAEHHIIRHREHNLEAVRQNADADKVMTTSGQQFPEGSTGMNLNMAYSSQSPVTYFAPSETGHRDPTGNAWEWTEDHFNPLKGFEVHHIYDDFSTPCFDSKHAMIVGGSFMSTGDEASVFARFHFRPHFLQHSGFRYVASEANAPATCLSETYISTTNATTVTEEVESTTNVYETVESLDMYLGLHYPNSGTSEKLLPIIHHGNAPNHGLRFPQRVANILATLKPQQTNNRVLDIGCAVGGSSFELAKTFDSVDAFDFSSSFIAMAQLMQQDPANVRFKVPIEADLFQEVAAVHDDGITSEIRSRVNFFVGDACIMDEMMQTGQLTTYDGIMMSNLLCRLPNPRACINSLPRLVNPGGIVVIVTPFSWLNEFTDRSQWLGGYNDPISKQAIRSKDVLKEMMESNGFSQVYEEEMPLIIREHQRKYQYIVSLATAWRKEI